jgi:hypothetical protein
MDLDLADTWCSSSMRPRASATPPARAIERVSPRRRRDVAAT